MDDGFARLTARLKGAHARLEMALGREILDAAGEMCVMAREAAPEGSPPRDQPRLKDSFSFEGEGLNAVVRVSNPHAAYVEFGTGRRGAATGAGGGYDGSWAGMAAQPYMQTSAMQMRVYFGRRLGDAAKRAI